MFNSINLKQLIKAFVVITLAISSVAYAEHKSKRIEVYSLSQNYWDTRYGDTLA